VYQHCRQSQICHCEKYFCVNRHLCQKFDHLPLPLHRANARTRTPQLRASSEKAAAKGILTLANADVKCGPTSAQSMKASAQVTVPGAVTLGLAASELAALGRWPS
jgi:hypothetical protein